MGTINVKSAHSRFNLRPIISLFLIALCGFGIYGVIKKISDLASGPKMMELYYKGAKHFNEKGKKDYLKGLAGFWTYDITMMVGGKPINKSDHLEIKDNGIVWEVVEWKMLMPSSAYEIFSQIRTAFINPYGVVKGDTLSDVYVLSQAFIRGGDTCFGGYTYQLWKPCELWQTCRAGDNLIVSKREYRPYKGDIGTFFPSGAVSFVENSEKQLYSDTIIAGYKETTVRSITYIRVKDPNTGKISLFPIHDSLNSLSDFFSRKLVNEYSIYNIRIHNYEEAIGFLMGYYQPFFIGEQWRQFPRDIPRTIQVSFTIQTDGTLDSVKLLSPPRINRMLSVGLTEQIKSWHFPSAASPIPVTYTFTMP